MKPQHKYHTSKVIQSQATRQRRAFARLVEFARRKAELEGPNRPSELDDLINKRLTPEEIREIVNH